MERLHNADVIWWFDDVFYISERNFLTFETVTVVPIQTKMIGEFWRLISPSDADLYELFYGSGIQIQEKIII